MPNMSTPKGEITVDDRGRVRGFNRIRAGKYARYRAVEGAGGVITLTPIISYTAAELADLQMRREKEHARDHPRDTAEIAEGIERASAALDGGDAATAAYLLEVPEQDVERVAGSAS